MRHAGQATRWSRLLRAALFALAVTGCAGPGGDGVGGTGVTASGDGIGGTGVTASTDGIGGTGIDGSADGIGGTGIVGVVSALGSVIVNGLHIELPADAVVTRNGRPAAASEVARGQVVAIVARHRGGRFEAVELQVLDALQGPVQRVDAAAGVLQMMGQTLRIDPARVVIDRIPGDLGGVVPGERLRVSGLWRAGGVLEVTRIEPADASASDLVFGPVTALADGDVRVGSLRVRGAGVRDAEPGQYVRATGVAQGGTLRADGFTTTPLADFQQRIGRLVVAAYPAIESASQVSLGPLRASLPAATRLGTSLREAAVNGERVVVDGRIDAGRIEIDAVRPADLPAPASRPAPTPLQESPRVETDAVPRPAPPASDIRPQAFERPVTVERPAPIERPVRPDALERPLRIDAPTDIRPLDALRP